METKKVVEGVWFAKKKLKEADCVPTSKKQKLQLQKTLEDTEISGESKKVAKQKLFTASGNVKEMYPASKIPYCIKDGIRFLDPYWSIYGSYTKARWIGREVQEVFTKEFLSLNKYYTSAAIRLGRIFVNGKQMINPQYRLRNNDHIIHLGHRHEHPILGNAEIKVISDTDKWLVINKPASIPVHTCGQYRVHSAVGLLRYMHDITGLRVVHRLDRATSGVLIFARDLETDNVFKSMIRESKWTKEYVCKVEGIFPEGEIVCEAPITCLSLSMGIQCIRGDGKPSSSKFIRISKNEEENTSMVLCIIRTGRTHQIRVHLQYLGFPIANDHVYNDTVWGPLKGRFADYGRPFEELQEDVQQRHKAANWYEAESEGYEERLRTIAENESQLPEEIDLETLDLDNLPKYDSICLGCNVTKRLPSMDHFRLYLHCWRYHGYVWHFEAPFPDWAEELENADVIKERRRL